MDKLQAMQVFARVVEAGTFTKAADSLALPKPTVTRLVQTLEAHLQTKLLNRTTRRVTVTADGPIADAGKSDLGRVMTNQEIANLPLISRNPLNFALQQANAGVTGRVPRQIKLME